MKSSLNSKVFFIHAKWFSGSFCDIIQPYKLLKSQYWIYDDSSFSLLSFMYLLLALAYQKMEWHIPPLIPFSTINNRSTSIKRSNMTLVFYKAACHADPGAGRNFAGSSLYISRHIFLKFSNTSA